MILISGARMIPERKAVLKWISYVDPSKLRVLVGGAQQYRW